MESFKKFLPFIIIAVLFLVGGYFIGKSAGTEQAASVYKTTALSTGVKPLGSGATGPMGGDGSLANSGIVPTITLAECKVAGGTVLIDGNGNYAGCFFPARFNAKLPAAFLAVSGGVNEVPITHEQCKAARGTSLFNDGDFIGCILKPTRATKVNSSLFFSSESVVPAASTTSTIQQKSY